MKIYVDIQNREISITSSGIDYGNWNTVNKFTIAGVYLEKSSQNYYEAFECCEEVVEGDVVQFISTKLF